MSTTITNIARQKILQADQNISTDGILDVHDAFHIISHPCFDGRLSDETPILGTDILKEYIVTITEAIINGDKFSNLRAAYDTEGHFTGKITSKSDSKRIEQLENNGFKVSDKTITFQEFKDHLSISFLNSEPFPETSSTRDKLNILAEKKEKIKNSDFEPPPLSDHAIEYYITKAELIREQLARNGYSVTYETTKRELDVIPPALFAVSKDAIIHRLEEKHSKDGKRFSIETPLTIITTDTVEHVFPSSQKTTKPSGSWINRIEKSDGEHSI